MYVDNRTRGSGHHEELQHGQHTHAVRHRSARLSDRSNPQYAHDSQMINVQRSGHAYSTRHQQRVHHQQHSNTVNNANSMTLQQRQLQMQIIQRQQQMARMSQGDTSHSHTRSQESSRSNTPTASMSTGRPSSAVDHRRQPRQHTQTFYYHMYPPQLQQTSDDSNQNMENRSSYSSVPIGLDTVQGGLVRRKDFLDKEEAAKSHPNRTYYYRKQVNFDKIIENSTKKVSYFFCITLQVEKNAV